MAGAGDGCFTVRDKGHPDPGRFTTTSTGHARALQHLPRCEIGSQALTVRLYCPFQLLSWAAGNLNHSMVERAS